MELDWLDLRRGCSNSGCLRMVSGLALMGKLSLMFSDCRPKVAVWVLAVGAAPPDPPDPDALASTGDGCSVGDILLGLGGRAGRGSVITTLGATRFTLGL